MRFNVRKNDYFEHKGKCLELIIRNHTTNKGGFLTNVLIVNGLMDSLKDKMTKVRWKTKILTRI